MRKPPEDFFTRLAILISVESIYQTMCLTAGRADTPDERQMFSRALAPAYQASVLLGCAINRMLKGQKECDGKHPSFEEWIIQQADEQASGDVLAIQQELFAPRTTKQQHN